MYNTTVVGCLLGCSASTGILRNVLSSVIVFVLGEAWFYRLLSNMFVWWSGYKRLIYISLCPFVCPGSFFPLFIFIFFYLTYFFIISNNLATCGCAMRNKLDLCILITSVPEEKFSFKLFGTIPCFALGAEITPPLIFDFF